MNTICENDGHVLKRLLTEFVILAAVCLFAGASRVAPSAWQLHSFGDVLRIREALSMFVFAPAIGVLFWLLVRAVAQDRPSRSVEILMVLTVYFIACGMGMHDPVNRMGIVYRTSPGLTPALHRTLVYLDDELGHWIFWAGFVLGSWVFGLQQLVTPLQGKMSWPWRCGFGAVALALLWVMLTNLVGEYPQTRVDLCVIAAAVLVPAAFHLAMRRKISLFRLPALCVIYPAYFGSMAGTMLYWWARYGKL